MYDIFSFPNITGGTNEEKIAQIYSYLIQLKEELEFQLMSISVDNLSSDLVAKLNELGANIEKSNQEREDQMQQVATKSISVSDVINSEMFKAEIASIPQDVAESLSFSVNFDTGDLEYTIHKEV